MSSKLAELQEEVDNTSQELEQQKSENSARMDEINALKQVRIMIKSVGQEH